MLALLCPLAELIYQLGSSIPLRSCGRFLNLLIGVLRRPGHVTDALIGSGSEFSWSVSYWWLSKGRWSHLGLARKKAWLLSRIRTMRCYLSVDDTVVYRSSRIAPGTKIHHEHSNKSNRPRFVNGQCLVFLVGTIFVTGLGTIPVPLLSRLTPTIGNTGKLKAVEVIWRVLKSQFKRVSTYVLMDAWFMRRSLIKTLNADGAHVIGQVRIDTALFEVPPIKSRPERGRPKKYGDRVNMESMKFERENMFLYNREYIVHYNDKIVVARFLGGQTVRAVWSILEDPETGEKRKMRLILSTDTSLTAREVIDGYARRWAIESFFHQVKHRWGLQKAWQQHRQTFARWVQILCTAYFIPAYLIVTNQTYCQKIVEPNPWRAKANSKTKLTVGLVQDGLAKFLGTSNIIAAVLEVLKNTAAVEAATLRAQKKLAA